MRTFRQMLVIPALVLVSACSSAGAGSSADARPAPSQDRNLLTQDELQRTSASNLFDAIRMLRPQWLRQSPTIIRQGGEGTLLVYLDGIQFAILERSQGDADKLRLLVEQAKKDYRSVLGGEAAASPPDPLSAVGTSPPGPLSAKRRGGTGVRAGEDEPRWVQVFIGICLCIPVLSWGVIPMAVGLIGAAWCRRIAWDLDRSRPSRVVACAGVTLLCYAVIALGLSGLALV